MIEATCHCGNIMLRFDEMPASLTSCNCSICHRLGALWAYFLPGEVSVAIRTSDPISYIWGDREVSFQHCGECGACTHYVTTEKCPEKIFAVNGRMLNPEIVAKLEIRTVDGASQ